MGKKALLTIAIIAVTVLAAIIFLNARIPSPTETDISDAVIAHYGTDIEEIRDMYGLSDLTLVLEFDDTKITKPTIFKEGTIFADVRDYFVCSELDNAELNEETYKKFSGILSTVCGPQCAFAHGYNKTEMDRYDGVYVSRSTEHRPQLMDTAGNVYDFSTDLYTHTIEMNGVVVYSAETGYTAPDLYSADGDSDQVCKHCGEVITVPSSGGYCKLCIDAYYTDYYIGLDGEVHPDRPY